MDSQEKALLQQSTLEDPAKKAYATKQEVLERVKEIAHSSENPNKEELDLLKTTFYKIHLAERDAQMKEYLAKGGDPEKYILLPDDTEEAFKAEMQLIKEKRAKIFLAQEEEKQDNLRKKEEIIEKIKAMTTSPEEANKSYQDFKALQQEWKEIKNIPADKANEVWKNYQLYVEQFYDMLKLNSEAANMTSRRILKPRPNSARLQRNSMRKRMLFLPSPAGPPPAISRNRSCCKELREQIWERFKAASTVINKKHQQHFEDLRAKEEENLAKKSALCEKVEAANQGEYKTAKDWEKVTQEVIEIQKEWRTIGFAPQKMNVKIFERFRIANDEFFNKKAEFFKGLKDTYSTNLEKKQQLVNKAKELADSTDWKKTGDKLIALQKEWKKVGTVPHKQGELLWKEFLDTCNKFFEARNKQNAGSRSEEHANLDKKRNIIAQLKELVVAEITDNDFQKKLKDFAKQYSAIGHVPFKEKDKVYKEYHEAIDAAYEKLHATNAKRHFDNFKNNLKNVAKEGGNALGNERGKLLRRYDQLRSEITTYENNLGFFNTASKKGNSLVEEMNRKIEKLKADLEMVKQKIKAIDAEKK